MSSSSTASENDASSSSSSSSTRIALLQFRVTESKERNLAVAADFLDRAAVRGAAMAVLPEIWNGPYATAAFSEYAETLPDVGDVDESEWSPSARLLARKAREHGMFVVGGSVPERCRRDDENDERIYNTCLCLDPDGVVVAKHRKVHLFDIDVPGRITFKESDTLSPGTSVTTFDAGDHLGRVGVGICYDIRFPELSQCMIERGCGILVFPGAFNLTTGPAHWELLQRGRAVDGQCYVLTASPARSDPPLANDDGVGARYPHYSAWGHSTAVSPWGEVVATCDENEHVVVVDVDMAKVAEMRESIPTASQKRPDLYRLTDVTKE